MLLAAAALLTIAQTSTYRLPIGPAGTVRVAPGQIVSTRSGGTVQVADVAAAADGHGFVYLGESHDNLQHHQMQAAVIEALVARGRDVVVGFEMFTRPNQQNLNPWTLGWWTQEQFVERADWKNQWGFDYALYSPIFEAVKRHRLPMVALNVPRDWVRAVGRGGIDALTPEQRSQVPPIERDAPEHRKVFESMMGGHPPTGTQGENIYTAQLLWDFGMADTAIKHLQTMPPNSKRVMVVLAGSGHVMYGQGINLRVKRRTGQAGITLTMIGSDVSEEVSRGLGDFVFNAQVVKNP